MQQGVFTTYFILYFYTSVGVCNTRAHMRFIEQLTVHCATHESHHTIYTVEIRQRKRRVYRVLAIT